MRTKLKLAVTGHVNIEKANGKEMLDPQEYDPDVFDMVKREIERMLAAVIEKEEIESKNLTLITGMARGVDDIVALYAMEHNLPLIAAIPYRLSWHRARKDSAIEYDRIIEYIDKRDDSLYKEIEKGFEETPNAFFARNQYMVDEADLVVSYLKYRSTGTLDTIGRAKAAEKYFCNIDELKV